MNIRQFVLRAVCCSFILFRAASLLAADGDDPDPPAPLRIAGCTITTPVK